MRDRHKIKNPLISVIVPTYNRAWLLRDTIESLVNQSYENIEVLIINDAGDDPSYFLTKYESDKRVKLFHNKENLGLAGTRNVGLKHAKGDYISLLDDDDIYLKYALELRMYMMNKLDAEVVYSRALLDIWQGNMSTGYSSAGKQLYWDSPFDKDLILVQNIAPCCCPLFSRKAWDESGNYKFDVNLETGEDFDFWIALSRKAYFHELKIVDCECTTRQDGTQMTGTKDFGKSYPIIYKRWRHTAINYEQVKMRQNNVLMRMGYPAFD